MTTTPQERKGCLTALLNLFRKNNKSIALPYQKRRELLSKAEIKFYRVLLNITNDTITICPKVGLKDIFYIKTKENYYSHFGRIAQKHVDFILCSTNTMKPILGVELDDSTHNQPKRQERDALVDKIFAAGNLPILHIRVQQNYNKNELKNLIEKHIQKQND